MPPYELFEAEQRGELILGGCDISDLSPTRACASCKYQFRSGRLAFLLMSDDFDHFEFSIGGFFGTGHRLLIEKQTDGYLMRYGRSSPYPVFSELDNEILDGTDDRAFIKRHLDKSEWEKIAQKLDHCEIIEWKRKNNDNDILDGTQWGIEIKAKGLRKISIYGSNAYPPYWSNFINLLKREVDPSIG